MTHDLFGGPQAFGMYVENSTQKSENGFAERDSFRGLPRLQRKDFQAFSASYSFKEQQRWLSTRQARHSDTGRQFTHTRPGPGKGGRLR